MSIPVIDIERFKTTDNETADTISMKQRAADDIVAILEPFQPHVVRSIISEVVDTIERRQAQQIDRLQKELDYLHKTKKITRRKWLGIF